MRRLPLWLSIIIILGSSVLMVIGLTYYLDTYTKHGKETEVPAVAKKNLNEALKILKDKGFTVEVDSTFRDSLPPLYVIKQFPEGGERVKYGRTIQLIVNKSAPPVVEMPSLLGVSVNSALQYLQRSNLKLGDTIFKPDFAIGRILQQMVNGKDVTAGTLLPFGTKVTLVIGSGYGSIIYNYPDFYGMTLRQAYAVLDTLGLSRGAIVVDRGTKDSLSALIYKQFPPHIDPISKQPTLIRQGNIVDLWVSFIPKPREIDTSSNYLDDATLEAAKSKDNGGIENKNKTPDKKPKDTGLKPKPEIIKPKTPANTGEDY
jgi:hypothetical protein